MRSRGKRRLFVLDLSKPLLARIPCCNIFDIRIAEIGNHWRHDGVLALPATEGPYTLAQVVLVLSAKIGVNGLDRDSRRAVASMADG